MRQQEGEFYHCCGHVSTDPNKKLFICVLVTVTIGFIGFFTTTIHFGYTFEDFAEANSNSTADIDLANETFGVGSIVLLIMLLSYYNLLKAGLTDPGIIRTNPSERLEEWQAFASRPPRRQRITGGNRKAIHSHYIKFIDGCNSFAPPGAELCSISRNCILRFDHHCPWIGNCVGLRNYKNFIGFLISIVIIEFLMFTFTIYVLVNLLQLESDLEDNQDKLIIRAFMMVALLVFLTIVAFFSLPLLSLHIGLILKGQTTFQLIRRQKYRFRSLQYSKELCCRPLPNKMKAS